MNRKPSRESRALRSVTEEARLHPAPELDDGVERRLFATIASQARPKQAARPRRRPFVWLVPTGAAAATCLFVWHLQDSDPVAEHSPAALPIPAAAPTSSVVEGDRLAVGDVLSAHDSAIEVSHPERARWWLEPGSRALLVAQRPRLVVRLLEGALRAEVRPSAVAERFVVESVGTRVAVRGTVFRVALESDGSAVSVERGVVAVGPLDPSAADPVLLRAPADARFSHDGQLHVKARETRVAPKPTRRSLPLVAPAPTTSAPGLLETIPDELTITQVEDGVALAVEAVTRCFEEHTIPSENARITVRTALTLDVLPDGTVSSVLLTPPLSPIVQECSERDARGAPFGSSAAGATITRWLELVR